jgi:hypothetical protein
MFDSGSVPTGVAPVAVRFLKCAGTNDLLFVADFTSNDIAVYAWNESLGTLTPVPGSPVPNQGGCSGPRSLAIGQLQGSGTHTALFVTNQTSQNIEAFSVDDNPLSPTFGALSASGVASVGVSVKGVAFATGNYVYAAGSNGTYGYSADPINGALTSLVAGVLGVAGTGTPERMTVGTTGSGAQLLFVTNFSVTPGGSSVSSFVIDPASGHLAQGTLSAPVPDGASGIVFLKN